VKKAIPFSRRTRRPSFANNHDNTTLLDSPPAHKEGGGAPKGASIHWPRQDDRRYRLSPVAAARVRRDALAFRRSTAALARGFRPPGSTPGHASWDVAKRVIRKSGNRFSEKITRSLKLAGVTRLHLSQSRDCTSRTGRSTGVNDARSRPGAGRNAARGNRSRSTFESTLAKGPSVNEMCDDVIGMVTDVKGASLKKR